MACRSEDKAIAAMSDIEALNPKGSMSALQLDVTDARSISDAATRVQQQFGRIDVLVNNAAVSGFAGSDLRTRFHLCLDTNVTGPAMVSEMFRPLLLKSANAYSIYVGTGARSLVRNATQKTSAHANIQNGHAYQVSKAALNMLAVLEWRDYGPEGLKVFVLSPGFVRSNLRGPDEEARSGWGMAGDPEDSGKLLLSVVQGERDADVGKLIHKDGVYEW